MAFFFISRSPAITSIPVKVRVSFCLEALKTADQAFVIPGQPSLYILPAKHLCRKFAARKADRSALEQYRPYVMMMNTRARIQLAIDDEKLAEALAMCQEGIMGIREFFKQMAKPELAEHCSELAILKSVHDEINNKLPLDPADALHADLSKALEREHYEKAAELRDKLRNLNKPNFQQYPPDN